MNEQPTAGDFFQRLKRDVGRMFADNIELAKAEIGPAAKAAGKGTGLFGAAGFFWLRGLSLLFYAAVFAVAMMFNQLAHLGALTSLSLAFLIVGVGVVLIGVVLAVGGKGQFKRVRAPRATMDEFRANLDALGSGIAKGRAHVSITLADTDGPESDDLAAR